jgi:hypothetical protein
MEKKINLTCQEFDPNNLQKQNQNYYCASVEWIKNKAILNIEEALLKRFKQERSEKVPATGTLYMIIFVLPKF